MPLHLLFRGQSSSCCLLDVIQVRLHQLSKNLQVQSKHSKHRKTCGIPISVPRSRRINHAQGSGRCNSIPSAAPSQPLEASWKLREGQDHQHPTDTCSTTGARPCVGNRLVRLRNRPIPACRTLLCQANKTSQGQSVGLNLLRVLWGDAAIRILSSCQAIDHPSQHLHDGRELQQARGGKEPHMRDATTLCESGTELIFIGSASKAAALPCHAIMPLPTVFRSCQYLHTTRPAKTTLPSLQL